MQKEIGCETIVADLGNVTEARRMAEQAGDVDLLVNNAAIAILEPLLETKVESWDATMAVNLRAVLIVSQVVAKRMIERGVSGSIVNVSMLARIPLQRFAECEDIASVVCFVLSDAAGMLNGLALRVNGGFWAT